MATKNYQLQTLTASGWRTIAEGSHQEISQKFQEQLLMRGQRRILNDYGVPTAKIAMGRSAFIHEVRS